MKDCIATMDALLKAMLQGGFGASQNESGDAIINTLDVTQVKITDTEGNLRRVFPAKGDLIFDASESIGIEIQ